MAKTLYKSKTDRKLCGVCGGVAEYLGVDVNIVRIAAIVSVFFGGLGVIAYIAAAFMLPEKDDNTQA
ncbi:MAG: PspC domain-containing protein [Clostridiales bacterium]|nr:MAG: PspC domain-containing protein [Clostridiales bacterium]